MTTTAATAVIDGISDSRLFFLLSGATLHLVGLTLTGAVGKVYGDAETYGAAVYIPPDGTASFTSVTFMGNLAKGGGGGAVFNEGTISSIEACNFTGNGALYGGALSNSGTITSINGCHFVANYGMEAGATGIDASGGALRNSGTISLVRNCTFLNNRGAYGGALHN
ncbi:unnamed protein product, partial [Phaeothamnion confervicola]